MYCRESQTPVHTTKYHVVCTAMTCHVACIHNQQADVLDATNRCDPIHILHQYHYTNIGLICLSYTYVQEDSPARPMQYTT